MVRLWIERRKFRSHGRCGIGSKPLSRNSVSIWRDPRVGRIRINEYENRDDDGNYDDNDEPAHGGDDGDGDDGDGDDGDGDEDVDDVMMVMMMMC